MKSRDNEAWLAQLRASGPVRDSAVGDLRAALLRGLRRALANPGTPDEAALEDAVQDALLRILDRLDQFAGRSRFVTWATAIAIRVALGERRRRRWRDVSLDQIAGDETWTWEPVVEENAHPERQMERDAILASLHAGIREALTDRQRRALVAELRGMPQDEIARHLRSNRNAVYKLTHDARRRLKRALERAGYGRDDIQAAFAR